MGSREFDDEVDLWQEPDLAPETFETPDQRRRREEEEDLQIAKRKREAADEDLPIAKRTRQATRLALEALNNPQAEPETTFARFPNFPPEIQWLVWECVPAVRRVVCIWGGHVIVEEGQSVAPNPITQVCKLARKATKKRMVSVRRPVARFSFDNRTFVPFDFDTVWDVGRLTGAARLMQEHLFPDAATPFNVVLPDQIPSITELKLRSPIPWEMLQTVAIGTGLKWRDLRRKSDAEKEEMKEKIRELFPKTKRIFVTSHIDVMDSRSENINLKVIFADEIPVLEEKPKIEVETEGVEKQLSTVRQLGDGQFFLESRYIPDENDLDLTGLGGVTNW